MKMSDRTKIALVFSLIILLLSAFAEAGTYVAFSLQEAEARLRVSPNMPDEIRHVGGITRLIGVVYDDKTRDLIIVGQANKHEDPLELDDLVVALRAVLICAQCPMVSIDQTPETEKTRKQRIRFEGGIANRRFGIDLLRADIVLKKLGLGQLRADIWGVEPYFDLSAEHWMKTGLENPIHSRFWFIPAKESFVGVREGIAVVKALKVKVKTEVLNATINGKSVPKSTNVRDEIGDRFAGTLTTVYPDVSMNYPELRRLSALFRLVGIAQGIQDLSKKYNTFRPKLDYWLRDYTVAHVHTPTEYPLLEAQKVRKDGATTRTMTVNGGIELQALILDLADRSLDAFRKIVLKSRRKPNSLSWEVPLEAWDMDDWELTRINDISSAVGNSLTDQKWGCSFVTEFSSMSAGREHERMATSFGSFALPRESAPFSVTDSFSPPRYSADIGGVLLEGAAKVEGAQTAQVDLNSGSFSLVVEGKNVQLAPETYRRFITALWSVYFSSRDPGISIDPVIDPNGDWLDKHLVRYIGKTINTDLCRVMREADYLAKKWWVGTERPDIAGFENPDDISSRRGYKYLASRRIWFVPEDMVFRRAGDMLLFDSGQMTVKTEYLFRNGNGMRADPADEQFAQFLTENYAEIAKKYPVFEELFEYGKMVSFAKYLKESGVPLYWFLMANKDLVLTEDSPGTVDGLVKESDYFRGITTKGGVDLGVQGNYVYDAEAVKIIHEALSGFPKTTSGKTSLSSDSSNMSVPESFSFDLGKHTYSVVPQHSLTCGKDRRGIRYQTDLALRATGLQLTQKSWQDLRSELLYREFAKEWNRSLGTNSKSKDESELQILHRTAYKKAKENMTEIAENLRTLINQKHKNAKEFAKAVERAIGKERAIDLIPVATKHAHYASNLELVRFYDPKRQEEGEFGKGWQLLIPYRIKPAGQRKTKFLNVLMPERMALKNLVTGECEILSFSRDRYRIVGYVPKELESSWVVGLFVMSDASYRLVDKLGNEFWFNQAGYLTDMSFSKEHHVHIEYVRTFTKAFEQSPYGIEPVGEERRQFLNAQVPTGMKVQDLVSGSSEVLFFSDEGTMAGYVPKDEERSRFKILALMSDASFRLLDQKGNEIAFGPDGKFDRFAVSPDEPPVASISTGPYRVDFAYTIDGSGRVLIAGAQLLEAGKAEPLYALRYEYDPQGRLCKAEKTVAKVTRFVEGEQEMVLAKK